MVLRKTTEQFIEEMKVKNPNIIVLGEYKNNHTKILCRCKKHNKEWETTPPSLLRGSGCVICKGEKISNKKTRSHKEFLKQLNDVRNDITLLGEYKKCEERIHCRCNVCGNEWYAFPDNLLRSQGCKQCANNKMAKERSKTHEQFVNELHNINKDIEVIGKYKNGGTEILCLCKKHNHSWMVKPNHLLRGGGCLHCGIEKTANRLRKTHGDFINELTKVNINIEAIGKYTTSKSPLKCKCKVDGTVFHPLPSNLLKGQGCPTCAIKRTSDANRMTQEDFESRVKKVLPNIKVLGEYKTRNEKIQVSCKKDGHTWMAKGSHLIDGHGCPKCKSSKGEKIIEEYLKDNFIAYKPQFKFKNCRYKRRLPFDFYLPELNAVIEYDGIQHFKPIDFFGGEKSFEYRKKLDGIKSEYCNKNRINLIRVPYTVDNIEVFLDERLLDKVKNLQLELII